MAILATAVDRANETWRSNAAHMAEKLAELQGYVDAAVAGGGPRYVERHRQRGKLLARERIELLLDRDAPFLELSVTAACRSEFHPGASVVTGIGVIEGVECVILANDPTLRGGTLNPISIDKILRALQICDENRLPMVFLVESGGADLPHQLDLFLMAGDIFRRITRLSARGIPTVSLVFGSSTAGGAYLPGMSDYVVMQRDSAKVFLGGPPLVKMATGEESSDEELGGALMHSTVSGVSDHLADDEHDVVRLGRRIVAGLAWHKLGPPPRQASALPRHDPDDLLGIASADLKVPFPVREVLARIVDGSELDEFKPTYGTNLVTGWAQLYGYPLGILANDRGVLFNEEANKAAQFIQLANQIDVALLFVQNVTGYMVGRAYEQRGMIKHGSHMVNAVANSGVPHLTLQIGGSFGAGNYGMAGRAYNPRFLFAWPNARTAVMGPEQLAGTLSIVARQAAAGAGQDFDEAADAARRAEVEAQIQREEPAFVLSSRLMDDGVIDPRHSRDVLGIALSATHSNVVQGSRHYGVFRM